MWSSVFLMWLNICDLFGCFPIELVLKDWMLICDTLVFVFVLGTKCLGVYDCALGCLGGCWGCLYILCFCCVFLVIALCVYLCGGFCFIVQRASGTFYSQVLVFHCAF